MVEAILDGRKTQTRRIIKPQPDLDGLWNHTVTPMSLDSTLEGWHGTVDATGESRQFKCPYGQPGDILWVRETWCLTQPYDPETYYFGYKCGVKPWSNEPASHTYDYLSADIWRPSIHMPREAARIFLQITNVRVHRLHDITTSQIKAEGVRIPVNHRGTPEQTVVLDIHGKDKALSFLPAGTLSGEYKPTQDQWMMAHWAELWCSINGRDSWDANPWVWAIEFQRVEA
jgi:hypothetical protein